MKAVSENCEYVILDETGVIDFESYIIPNVFHRITAPDSWEEQSILAVGAVIDGAPCGAVVAQLLETNEVFLHSIVVDEKYRNNGIGSTLLDAVLQRSEEELEPDPGEDHDFMIFVHADYALSGDALTRFEDFLKKNRFTDFLDAAPVYVFDNEGAAGLGRPSAAAKCFAEIPGVDAAQLETFFTEQGIYPDLTLSFFNGTEDEPKCLLLVQNPEEGVYLMTSTDQEAGTGMEDLDELFRAALHAIAERSKQFRLVVNPERNAYPELWSRYEDVCALKSVHREAGAYLVFE